MSGGDLVFIGDVHLQEDAAQVDAFLAALDRLAATTARLVLMGDLFDLWIGRREMERPQQQRVVEFLARLRRRGMVVRYVEGNRDYGVAAAHSGGALDDASEHGLVERIGGHSLFAIHGDRARSDDWPSRLWRRLSRSAPFWNIFHDLPVPARIRLADALERRMRRMNVRHKQGFPEDAVRAYAAPFLARGHDAVVLGHFHVERDLVAVPPSPPGRILVLPEWKSTRRHLRVGHDGTVEFVATT